MVTTDQQPRPTKTLSELEQDYGEINSTIPAHVLNAVNGRYSAEYWFHDAIETVTCAVSPILPLGVPTLLFGEGGIGKSSLLAQIAICICTGRPLDDFPVNKGSVVIFSLEDSIDQYRRRIRATGTQMKLSPEERKLVADNLHIFDVRGMGLHLTRAGSSSIEINSNAIESITNRCNQIGNVKLLALETLSRFLRGGHENSNSDAAVFVEALDILARQTGAATLLTHHTSKLYVGQKLAKNSARGASAFVDNSRSTIGLGRMPFVSGKNQCALPKSEFDGGRVIGLQHLKANMTELGPRKLLHLRGDRVGPYLEFLDGTPAATVDPDVLREQKLKEDVQKTLSFLAISPEHFSTNRLEKEGPTGIGRNEIRDAVRYAKQREFIEDLELPTAERHGGRKTYLSVTERGLKIMAK